MLKYYVVYCTVLHNQPFLILLYIFIQQHFIFIISGILAWLIPDVPQSVKNEIQKEKLLAYEAIHARHDAGKELGVKGGSKSQATNADSG